MFSRLQRPTYDGFPQESIVRGMEDGQDFITEEQRTAIMERLRDAKTAVRQAAHAALIGGQSPDGPTFTVQSGTIEVTYVQNNTGIVGGQGNQVVSAQTISGTVVNGMIRDSFNTIESSDAAPTLKEELSKLATMIGEMTAQLDGQKAAAVERDLRTMTEEAVDPKPRRGAFDVSAAGLLEAASFVGDFSTRIASSLAAVVKLIF